MTGRELTSVEVAKLWRAWTPTEVGRRLSGVDATWCVTAGWALNLFTESAARGLHDVEIALPAGRFDEAMDALPGFQWDVVGGGRVWPFPEQCAQHFQTWLREPGTGIYRLDVFREPSIASRWACGHDLTIRLPNDELILHSDDGIPYVISEVALLFKAEHVPPRTSTTSAPSCQH